MSSHQHANSSVIGSDAWNVMRIAVALEVNANQAVASAVPTVAWSRAR